MRPGVNIYLSIDGHRRVVREDRNELAYLMGREVEWQSRGKGMRTSAGSSRTATVFVLKILKDVAAAALGIIPVVRSDFKASHGEDLRSASS